MLPLAIIEENISPDVEFDGDQAALVPDEILAGTQIKVFLNDFSFELVANKKFETQQEITEWARQWFRRKRDNLIFGRGRIIGVETMKARQVHALEGMSKALDGDYYFTRVKHIMNVDSGYWIDFNARKHVPL